jgi:hypothetical protein
MGRETPASAYYPPRARWYSSLWRIGYLIRQRLRFPIVAENQRVCRRTVLGVILPGWALVWSKRPNLGVILGTAYCLAVPAFLIWRGYAVSNAALMLMITIHAGGILRIESSHSLWMRCATSFLVFFALAALIYAPLLNQIDRHWFVALRTGNQVVVIRTGGHYKIHRGDHIAYRIGSNFRRYVGPVRVMSGLALGRVLAIAGDEVTFLPDKVLVNGETQRRQPYMPTNETVRVQERCWFIWPEMNISGAGQIERTLLELAMVPDANFVGVPYQSWFWRKQVLP